MSEIVNHEEAYSLACVMSTIGHQKSNLARCYLELRAENETLNAAAQFKVQHGGFTQLRDAVMEVCV